jgi:hypothetical protein
VIETNVLHAADVIYWLDGTTADTPEEMQRIAQVLSVEFTERPTDLETLTKAGRMAFWRRPGGTIVNGTATEAQKTRTAVAPFNVAGTVWDAERLYNPRVFAVTLGSGAGHGIVLYRSPAGARWSNSGGLFGTLALVDTGAPVPWGLLELTVEVSQTDTLTFRAQADRNGDFAFALNRLPPLPENVTEYSAQLTLKADLAADAAAPVNIDLLDAVLLGEIDDADSFEEEIDIEVRPGEVQRIQSMDVTYLAVQATD